MKNKIFLILAAAAAISLVIFVITSHAGPGGRPSAYVVFAWNEEGGDGFLYFDGLPRTSLRAQVIRRGDPPQIVTDGVVVEYRLGAGRGISGCMARRGDHYQADGLPVPSVGANERWDPYQAAEIILTDNAGNQLARTLAAVPTSDEVCGLGADTVFAEDRDAATKSIEERCACCHGTIREPDAGALYGISKGHGGLYCPGCHEIPHPLSPSKAASFYYRASQYQPPRSPGRLAAISSCAACHETSAGPAAGSSREAMERFEATHGGPDPRRASACNICHTAFSMDTKKWPHGFVWREHSHS